MPKSRSVQPRRTSERARAATSYERRSGDRAPRRSVLIVCEGLATEPGYFNALRRRLRLSLVDVHVAGEGRAPITVVERAIELMEQRERNARKAQRKGQNAEPPFDEVWCVFDMERLQDNPSFPRAVVMATARGFELAVSNPAFEFWYLLHFEETSRPFYDAAELARALQRYVPDYAKNLDLSARLYPHMDIAITRAERVLEGHAAPALTFPNPSTEVHRLVILLQSMATR